jgi:hypothetical protein
MSVFAIIAIVGALPQPPIEMIFNCLNELGARNIYPLGIFGYAVSRVIIDVNLGCFPVQGQIMGELALLSFLANTCFEFGT